MAAISSVVTDKGRTTLPREVRDAIGLQPGDRVVYEIEGDIVHPRSARRALDALYGAFARPELGPHDLDATRARFPAERARAVMEDASAVQERSTHRK